MIFRVKNFDKYSAENVHFYNDFDVPLLEDTIRLTRPRKIIDLGCGDGAVLYNLERKGLLKDIYVYGCDLSNERLERLRKKLPFVRPVEGSAANLKQFQDGYFDMIICSQLIEHMDDDESLLREIHRLLKPNGDLYISSIIRKWYGWWVYRNKGRVVCDPTHIREYSSKEVFENLLIRNGFKPLKVETYHFKPSVVNAVGRVLHRYNLIAKDTIDELYTTSPLFNKISRLLSIPVPGYLIIEAVVVRGDAI